MEPCWSCSGRLQVYYLTFMCGSTCFGRLPAHHQEHATELGASSFTVGEKRLERCWLNYLNRNWNAILTELYAVHDIHNGHLAVI